MAVMGPENRVQHSPVDAVDRMMVGSGANGMGQTR
jgi:hypothetical protein